MAAASPDPEAIGAAVRGHRVYHEVYAERAIGARGRPVVAVEVRLWSTLGKAGAKVLAARAAAEAATLVGAAALGEDGAGDLEPFHSALYDSRQVPGADEIYVAIALRLHGEGAEAERDRDRRLQALRHRLEALGVHAGRWREAPARPAEAPEPWSVQRAATAA
ncbi:MAG: hypothetical protein QM704_28120 [Anaeromyxobacteraceae bacterium]